MRSRPSRSLAVRRDPRSGRQIFRKALFLALVDLGQTGRRLSPHIFSQLWVWVFRCLEGVHREIALQRPLLAAPQGYLRSQSAGALTSLGNTPTTLVRLFTSSNKPSNMFVVRMRA